MENLVVNFYLLNNNTLDKCKLICFGLIFMFCFNNKGFAQVDSLFFTPDTFYALCGNQFKIDTLNVDIKYNSIEKVNVYWKLNRGSNFDPKLMTQVIDLNICYIKEILQTPKTKPNEFPDLFSPQYSISLKIIEQYKLMNL